MGENHNSNMMMTGGAMMQQSNRHNKREGFMGFFWKLSRIGERLSPYVGAGCVIMAINILFFR